MTRCRPIALCLVFLGTSLLGVPVVGAGSDPERVMSATELKQLERENAMWRQVRVEEDAAANMRRWREAGFTAAEVAALQPQLTLLWAVPAERNFGWLRAETVEQIKAVDREYIVRMRAVRLQLVGIRGGQPRGSSEVTVNQQWRQAILKVLDYDEVSEFRLMNSVSAQKIGRLVDDLDLTPGEQRMLFTWQKEFDGMYGTDPFSPGTRRADLLEAKLEQWSLIRGLLGDERFSIYLARAEPDFVAMRQELVASLILSPTETLDLWWLHQKYDLAKSRQRVTTPRFIQGLAGEYQGEVTKLMGAERSEVYFALEAGRWLFPPEFQNKWVRR